MKLGNKMKSQPSSADTVTATAAIIPAMRARILILFLNDLLPIDKTKDK